MVTGQLDLVFIQKMSVCVDSSLTTDCYPLTMHIKNHNTFFLYFLLLYICTNFEKKKKACKFYISY